MNQDPSPRRYDLEERTLRFAKDVIGFTGTLPKSVANSEIARQVIRSSGSVGANYIEANEALSRKDFAMRVRICRKEARETGYWLRLLELSGDGAEGTRQSLIAEATELTKIFSSIAEKAR